MHEEHGSVLKRVASQTTVTFFHFFRFFFFFCVQKIYPEQVLVTIVMKSGDLSCPGSCGDVPRKGRATSTFVFSLGPIRQLILVASFHCLISIFNSKSNDVRARSSVLWPDQLTRPITVIIHVFYFRNQDIAVQATMGREDSEQSSFLRVHLPEWARCQKAIGGIYFTKKQRAETLQPRFRIWQFIKPGLIAVSSNASPGWTVRFFGGDDLGFLKERI